MSIIDRKKSACISSEGFPIIPSPVPGWAVATCSVYTVLVYTGHVTTVKLWLWSFQSPEWLEDRSTAPKLCSATGHLQLALSLKRPTSPMLVVESSGGMVMMLWDDDVTVPPHSTHSTDISLRSGLPLYSYILAGQQPRQLWCNRIDCLLWTLDSRHLAPHCWHNDDYNMVFSPFSFLGHISSILEDIWTLNHASSLFVAKQKEINNPSCCIVFLSLLCILIAIANLQVVKI